MLKCVAARRAPARLGAHKTSARRASVEVLNPRRRRRRGSCAPRRRPGRRCGEARPGLKPPLWQMTTGSDARQNSARPTLRSSRRISCAPSEQPLVDGERRLEDAIAPPRVGVPPMVDRECRSRRPAGMLEGTAGAVPRPRRTRKRDAAEARRRRGRAPAGVRVERGAARASPAGSAAAVMDEPGGRRNGQGEARVVGAGRPARKGAPKTTTTTRTRSAADAKRSSRGPEIGTAGDLPNRAPARRRRDPRGRRDRTTRAGRRVQQAGGPDSRKAKARDTTRSCVRSSSFARRTHCRSGRDGGGQDEVLRAGPGVEAGALDGVEGRSPSRHGVASERQARRAAGKIQQGSRAPTE